MVVRVSDLTVIKSFDMFEFVRCDRTPILGQTPNVLLEVAIRSRLNALDLRVEEAAVLDGRLVIQVRVEEMKEQEIGSARRSWVLPRYRGHIRKG